MEALKNDVAAGDDLDDTHRSQRRVLSISYYLMTNIINQLQSKSTDMTLFQLFQARPNQHSDLVLQHGRYDWNDRLHEPGHA